MKIKNEFFAKGYTFLFFMGIILLTDNLNTLNAQTYRNCSEIHFFNPSASSGVYEIDPDGVGPISAMNCQCDMTTDGGGWTLVLNYNHLENTTPDLQILAGSFPLQGHVTLGNDESNTVYWGHAGISLMNVLPFDEVRFYGITWDHDRVIDFKTSHAGTVSYFKTGSGSTEGIKTEYIALAAHTSFLPASIDHTVSDMGDYAMTNYPLWTGAAYHWYLGGVDPNCTVRWEVDNYPCSYTPSTFHQIWVRQNEFLGFKTDQKSGFELELTPNPCKNKSELTITNCTPEQIRHLEVKVFTLLGELVNPVITRNPSSFTIEKGTLPPGIYLCQLTNESGELYIIKMVMQ